MPTEPLLEVISPSEVRIRDRVLKMHYSDPPLEDGDRYGLHATSQEGDPFRQTLDVHDLRGVTPAAFPVGFCLTIDKPKAIFQDFLYVNFQNLRHGPEIEIPLYFDFSAWQHPINLIDFADRFVGNLEVADERVRVVTTVRAQECVYIHWFIRMNPNDDCCALFRQFDSLADRTYRETLRSYRNNGASDALTSRSEEGMRWWIRYVIVPIACSGALAALIALLWPR